MTSASIWKATIVGKEEEWDAEITEQIPDQRIAWTSKGGAMNADLVMFYPLSDTQSKLTLQMEYVPNGAVEKTGDVMGLVTKIAFECPAREGGVLY